MSGKFTLYIPREVILGIDSFLELPQLVESLNVSKGSEVILVIDPALEGVDRVAEGVNVLRRDFCLDVYKDVEYEPSVECARRLAAHVREEKPDIVIGVGGGSTLDLAKIAAISIDDVERDVEDFLGFEKVSKRKLPLILIPTTAGTGSEVSKYVTLIKGSSKVDIVSKHVLPDIALVDPMLTLTMPPRLTAATGLDALSHAIEAFISTDATPLTDVFSIQSTGLIFRYLRRAYYNGKDLEARYFMSLAATSAGVSLTAARVVLGHSVSQTFGPRYGVHHGVACGMTLPYIMDFYLPALTERFASLADVLAICETSLGVRERAERLVWETWELVKDLDIPLSLREVGVSRAELEDLAKSTLRDFPRPNSPIELTKERVLKLYETMYEGSLRRVKIAS